ncbi:MAG: hypothetical protein ABI947_17700 [Chloroflexota bacterium]
MPTLTPSVTPVLTLVAGNGSLVPQSKYCLEYLGLSDTTATLYQFDVLGSGAESLRRLTGIPSLDVALPSPDGRYTAYTTDTDGNSHATLFVRDFIGDNTRFIVDARNASAAWSPNGQQLAYLWQIQLGKDHYDTFLAISNADGSAERISHVSLPIAQYEAAYIDRWSPDGKYITLGFGYTYLSQIRLIRVSDFANMALEMSSPIGWRPDSQQIAFQSNLKIVLATPEGEYIQSFQLQQDDFPWKISWSPGQKYLAATNLKKAEILNPSTGKATSLQFDEFLSNWWSADGNAWMYFEPDAGSLARLMRFDVATESSLAIITNIPAPRSETYDNPLKRSITGRIAVAVPDGFILSDENVGQQTFVKNHAKQVTFGANYFSWSPDGTYFVAADEHNLFWTKQDGSQVQVDTHEEGAIVLPTNDSDPYAYWSKAAIWLANHQLAYIVLTEHDYVLYVLNLETGVSTPIMHAMITPQPDSAYPWVLDLSPNHRYGVLTRGDPVTNDFIEPVLIDFVQQQALPHDLRAFARAIGYVRWSPDNRFFAAVGLDQVTSDPLIFHTTVYVFDVLHEDVRAVDMKTLAAIERTIRWKACQ